MNLEKKSIFHIKPQDFFKYSACSWCRNTPCRFIQFQGPVRHYGVTFKIVHNDEYQSSQRCPFAADSFDEIEKFLRSLQIHDIHFEISKLLGRLAPIERLHYKPAEKYLWNWKDFEAKVEYLRILWRDRIYAFIRNPLWPEDEKVVAWLDGWHAALDMAPPREEEKPPVTDATETSPGPAGPKPELKDDAFRHIVSKAAKDRPSTVKPGDKIMLTIKTKNIADGEMVVIKVYNTAGALARTLETLEARVKGNVAEAEWTVAKDEKQAECELEWDGNYRGVVSGRGKIEFEAVVSKKPHRTSENGKQFIMGHEGFRPHPYNDSAEHATIGYGTMLHKGPVTDDDQKQYANGITQEEGRKLFDKAIIGFETALNRAVKVPLNQNQFDALMSWTYNFGPGCLIERDNKWLRELNAGNYDIIPGELLRWNKETKNGVKVESEGLTKRRRDEGELFKRAI